MTLKVDKLANLTAEALSAQSFYSHTLLSAFSVPLR
jgi:hypothetical protein